MYNYMQYECINLILINLKALINLKVHPGNHISFFNSHTWALLKHVADKNKTFAFILNLASYTLIQVIVISL